MKEQVKRSFETKAGDVTVKADVSYPSTARAAGDAIVVSAVQMLKFVEAPGQRKLNLDTGVIVELDSDRHGLSLRIDKPKPGEKTSLGLTGLKIPLNLANLLYTMAQNKRPVQIVIRQEPEVKKKSAGTQKAAKPAKTTSKEPKKDGFGRTAKSTQGRSGASSSASRN